MHPGAHRQVQDITLKIINQVTFTQQNTQMMDPIQLFNPPTLPTIRSILSLVAQLVEFQKRFLW